MYFSYIGKCAFDYWVQVVQSDVTKISNHATNFKEYFTLQKTRKWLPVTESRCLRAEPSWMSDHKEEFGELRLKDILFVGTHDAAAFQ